MTRKDFLLDAAALAMTRRTGAAAAAPAKRPRPISMRGLFWHKRLIGRIKAASISPALRAGLPHERH